MPISTNMYQALLSVHNLALLSDWLAETKELLVYLDFPHSAGNHNQYLIKSLLELRAILAKQTWPEIYVIIFRERQYLLRGLVTDPFVTTALKSISEGQQYVIVRLEEYPSQCEWLNDGDSHEQLKGQLDELRGEMVGIGADPWKIANLRAQNSYTRIFSFFVSKNQNYYEPYAKSPEQYVDIITAWNNTQ